MTEVPGVIIKDLLMITAVTGPTKTADGTTGTDVTDETVTTDETGTTVTDEDLDRTDRIEVEIGRGEDHPMTGEGGKMTTGDVGRMRSVGRLREEDGVLLVPGVRLVLRGEGGETLTGIDAGPLRRRDAGQRRGGGMRKTDAGRNYANKRRLILPSKTYHCFLLSYD